MGLLSVYAASGEQQLERRLLTDDGWQRDRQPEAVVGAQLGEVGPQAGVGCGDAKIGRQREPQAATDCCTLQGSNNRGLGSEHAQCLLVDRAGPELSAGI